MNLTYIWPKGSIVPFYGSMNMIFSLCSCPISVGVWVKANSSEDTRYPLRSTDLNGIALGLLLIINPLRTDS